MWKHYPERCVAKNVVKREGRPLYPDAGVYGIDNSKSKRDLDLQYGTLDDMLKDTLKKFVELEAGGK